MAPGFPKASKPSFGGSRLCRDGEIVLTNTYKEQSLTRLRGSSLYTKEPAAAAGLLNGKIQPVCPQPNLDKSPLKIPSSE